MHVLDMAVGAFRAENLLIETMRMARGSVVQELHSFGGSAGQRAMLDAIDAGAHVRALTHERVRFSGFDVDPALGRAADVGALEHQVYGSALPEIGPAYPHSKLLAASRSAEADAPIAAFSNVSFTSNSPPRSDITIRFDGDAAAAAHRVVSSTLDGNTALMGAAIDDAHRAGLLLNDPFAQRTHLADAMHELVDGAHDRLIIVSKGIDDEDFARRIVAAHQRGVSVRVSAREVAEPSARILDAADVPVTLQPSTGEASRLNVMIADDVGIASTSYQWQPMLAHPFPNTPIARDSGVVLRGESLATLESQLRDVPEGAVAFMTPQQVAAGGGMQATADAASGARTLRDFEPLHSSFGTRRVPAELE